MNIGIPEIVWIVLCAMNLGIALVKDGEPKGNYSFWLTLLALGIEFWIVWAGGFFQ